MSNTAPVEEMTLEELRVCVTDLRRDLAAARAANVELLTAPMPDLSPVIVTLTPEQREQLNHLLANRNEQRDIIQIPYEQPAGDQNDNAFQFDFDFTLPLPGSIQIQGDAGLPGEHARPAYICLELPL